MDIIGKIYRDFFVTDQLLDGKSHNINNFEFGGVYNIIKEKKFLPQFINPDKIKFHIATNKNCEFEFNSIVNNFHISRLLIDDITPTALIFDCKGSRTSYVFDDNLVEIQRYTTKSKSACVFYADKLYSESFNQYNQIYLDTAGNSYKDLMTLSERNSFKKGTVISISKEYLTTELLKNFLHEDRFIVMSHDPTITELHFYKRTLSIPNKHYINPDNIHSNVKTTGLGDIFFIIISSLNYHQKVSLEESVRKAQKIIASFLISNI